MAQPSNKLETGNSANLTKRGRGRPKGSKNKLGKALKEMILEALDEAGGVEYLVTQSEENPASFLTLVGKVLPLQLTGEDGDAIKIDHKVREDADAVTSAIAGLAERARAAGVAGETQH